MILPAAVRQPLCEAQHWKDQLCLPVRFSVALELRLRSLTHGSVVVEVGPNPVLIGMSKAWIERLKEMPSVRWVPSLNRRGGQSDIVSLRVAAQILEANSGIAPMRNCKL